MPDPVFTVGYNKPGKPLKNPEIFLWARSVQQQTFDLGREIQQQLTYLLLLLFLLFSQSVQLLLLELICSVNTSPTNNCFFRAM